MFSLFVFYQCVQLMEMLEMVLSREIVTMMTFVLPMVHVMVGFDI